MEDRDILLAATLFAAIRTTHCESHEFQGMGLPRTKSAVADGIWMATEIAKRIARDREAREYKPKPPQAARTEEKDLPAATA